MNRKLPYSGTNKGKKKNKKRRIHLNMKYKWPLKKNLGIEIKQWKPFYEKEEIDEKATATAANSPETK